MGWPLLEEGAEVVAPIRETPWRLRPDEHGEQGAFVQSAPTYPTTQQVFEHEIELEPDGTARAALINPSFNILDREGLALEIAYDGKAMPALFQWQNFRSGAYVMALEPCTTHAGNRKDWHDRGEFKILEHGETASLPPGADPSFRQDRNLGSAISSRIRAHRRRRSWPLRPVRPR